MEYPKANNTVDNIVLTYSPRMSILLIKRGKEPFIGKWALPGGFINPGEEPADAAERELYEETGIKENSYYDPFPVGTYVSEDPRGWTLTSVYLQVLGCAKNVKAGDDAVEAEWFPLNKLPDMAFNHRAIIEKAIDYFETLRDDW